MRKKLLFFLVLAPIFLLAQQRFHAGAVLGLTASQIDGDLSAGYNKLGFQGGMRVVAGLTKRMDASMEILFSQRGSRNELIPSDFDPTPFAITINYIEVPIQWHFKDWLIEYDEEKYNYYKMSFNAGLSYARLFSTKVEDELNVLNIDPALLEQNDLSLVIGANFFANRHLGFGVRWNRSLLKLYDPTKHPQGGKTWTGHCLYFQTMYMF